MTDAIEFDPVDRITTGAVGRPGERTFLIQAGRGAVNLSVLVEKEQVAMLSARLLQLLAELDEYLPDDEEEPAPSTGEVPAVSEQEEPLFRARMLRLGFDTAREMVVLELFEDVPEEIAEADPDELDELTFTPEGHVARLFATRAQMRRVAIRGAEAVAAGRPQCRLCMLPMDPDGHDCPSKN
ncbi:MAG: DUF3090 family protein [Actinobacteria bacterium]|nr:DUF3090 family protein [Actinomycetota bacterium]